MEVESWRKYHRGIAEEEPWEGIKDKESLRHYGAGIMAKGLWRRNPERNHCPEAPGRRPGSAQEASRRHPGATQATHPGDTQKAPRRHQETFRIQPGDTQAEPPRRQAGYQRGLYYAFLSEMNKVMVLAKVAKVGIAKSTACKQKLQDAGKGLHPLPPVSSTSRQNPYR